MQNDEIKKTLQSEQVEFIDSKGKSSFRPVKLPLPPSYRLPVFNKCIGLTSFNKEDISHDYVQSEVYHLHTLSSTRQPQYVEDSWYERVRDQEREASRLREYNSTEMRLDRIEKLLKKIVNPKADE